MANHTSLVEELECKYTQYIQQLLRQKTLLLAKLQKDFNKELQRLNTLSVQVPSQNTKQVNSPHDEAVMTEFPVNTGANKANAILIDDEDMTKSQSESLQATQSDILTDTKYNALFTNPTPIVAAPPPPAMVFAVARSNTNVVANSAIINTNNKNNNSVKRKRGRPRKYKTVILPAPLPKAMDRKYLLFMHYLKGDGTGPEMQIKDLSQQKNAPAAKGFNKNKRPNVTHSVGGRDKEHKTPPLDHKAYKRIRVWKDKLGRQFYDCICNGRKPVQNLCRIKEHALGHESHDGMVWVCEVCGREFFNNYLQLNSHMQAHKNR
eukprot:88936_1